MANDKPAENDQKVRDAHYAEDGLSSSDEVNGAQADAPKAKEQ